jgi:hypothetical protein
MPISLYEFTVPVWVRLLTQFERTLDKAEAHAAEKKIDPPALITARLFPDMWNFARQVNAVANHATRGAARLAGIEPPSFDGRDETFADLKARVVWARQFVEGIDRAAIEAGAERQVTYPAGGTTRTTTGADYLLGFSLPNFYFHLTTAYDILRHNGVPLRKPDFTGPT